LVVIVGADNVVSLPGALGDEVVADVGSAALAPVDGLTGDLALHLIVGRD
jgi:hypothetical protein